jgi:uncharacterized protein (DUF2342 family)
MPTATSIPQSATAEQVNKLQTLEEGWVNKVLNESLEQQ